MKYSNYIGIAAAAALIAFCFFPWVYIQSVNTIVTGLRAEHTNFGKPGLLHIILAVISIVFFVVQKIWAKRINLFVCTFNLAWSIRNFLIVTQCEQGDCPEKRAGIYAVVLLSILMLVMSTLPEMKLKE